MITHNPVCNLHVDCRRCVIYRPDYSDYTKIKGILPPMTRIPVRYTHIIGERSPVPKSSYIHIDILKYPYHDNWFELDILVT